jgi:integral membrane protein (TIGR01906 family)
METQVEATKVNITVRWLVTLALPLLLASGTILAIIAWDWPSYPSFEYGRIAPDRFGLSDAERLELAESTLEYLRRTEPADDVIFLLEELRLPRTDEPLYNEREIEHMLDVKYVTDAFKRAFRVLALVVVAGLAYLLSRADRRTHGYRALFYGGVVTTGILLAMLILMLVAWNAVFTQFHNLFFDPGTWTFAYTDSLIRLFPEQFWFELGIIWVGFIFAEGLLLLALGYRWLRRT